MIKSFTTFVFLISYLMTYGQQVLRIEAIDSESFKPLQEAEIKLIGTDGSKVIKNTDKDGIAIFNLDSNTSYAYNSIIPKYMRARGIVTTVGKHDSIVFNHVLKHDPVVTFHEGFTSINFDSTFSYNALDLSQDTILLIKYYEFLNLSDDSSKLFHLIKKSNTEYRVQGNEIETINIELIDTSLVEISIKEDRAKYWLIGYSDCHSYWYELIKEKN